jgi:hypothetical protein
MSVTDNSGESIPVFEVYGPRADAQGWDFIVYKTLQDAIDHIESDLDGLPEDGELRIVFKRYTQEQMDEVIYE